MSRITSEAVIYFQGYGSKIKADLHKVGDCFVIDYSKGKFDFSATAEDEDIDYVLRSRDDGRYASLELGIIVAPEGLLRKVEK